MPSILRGSALTGARADYHSIMVIVLAVALVLRLVWAIFIPVIPISDATVYDALARMLAEHGVYGWTINQPTARWPIGTSAIYAGLYLIFGYQYLPIVVLNIALGTAIVGLTFWLGKTFLDGRSGLVAACLMAIWPSNVMFVTILSSELPFTFFVLLGYWAWYHYKDSKLVGGVGSGLAFSAATYVRPIALLLPIILWLFALPNWRRLRAQIPALLVAIAVIAITTAPWSIRNTRTFGHLVLLSTNGGINLWIGNNPNSTGTFMETPPRPANMNEYEEDQMLGKEARQYIFDHPIVFALRTIKKVAILHVGETIAVHWNADGIKQELGENALFPLKLLTQAFWTGVLLLGIGGLVVMTRDLGLLKTVMHPVVLTWAYFIAVYAVFFGADRYHFPSDPFIALLAAKAILFVSGRARRHMMTLQT